MKIRMVSIILRDNYFLKNKTPKFYTERLTDAENVHLVLYNYVILTQVSVPPEGHQLPISATNC